MPALIRLRVSDSALEWSYRLLGAATVAMALQEAASGHLGVCAGELYGRRPVFLPLLPVGAMIALWLVQAAAGLAIATACNRRIALRVAAAIVILGLTQSYFNQKMFLALTLAALSLDGPDAHTTARAQLLLLYVASAAFKLRDGFGSGASLTAALEQVRDRGLTPLIPATWTLALLTSVPFAAKALGWSTIALESVLPLLLVRRPVWGFILASLMHLSFSACLPGVWPFTLTACAAALLFIPPNSARIPR